MNNDVQTLKNLFKIRNITVLGLLDFIYKAKKHKPIHEKLQINGRRAKSRCFTTGPSAKHNFSQHSYTTAVFHIPNSFRCFQVFFIPLIVNF